MIKIITIAKAKFHPREWNGLLPKVVSQKRKYRFWINNGRASQIWQSLYHDQHVPYRSERYPMALAEINPEDATGLKLENGDIVENLNQSVCAG